MGVSYTIRKIILPQQSVLRSALPKIDYSDSYYSEFNSAAKPFSPGSMLVLFFYLMPLWALKLISLVHFLLKISGRNIPLFSTDRSVIKAFEPEIGNCLGLFKVWATSEKEIIIGYNDKYLQFRNSILLIPLKDSNRTGIAISTIVFYPTIIGKIYFRLAKPVHRAIIFFTFKKLLISLNKNSL